MKQKTGKKTKATGLAAAKAAAGGAAALGRIVGYTRQAISKWTEIPVEQIDLIEKRLKIKRTELRPDLWR